MYINSHQVKRSNNGNPIFTNIKDKVKVFYNNNAKECMLFYPDYKCINYDKINNKE